MPVAEKPQVLQALERANEIRLAAVEERRELHGAPVGAIVAAVLDPTPALASLRLGPLFAPTTKSGCPSGLIARVGRKTLNDALAELTRSADYGRRNWRPQLRLRDLTRRERGLLIRAVVKRSPRAWREAP